MKKIILALAILTAAAAHATPGGEPHHTGCNGKGNANSPCAGTGGQGGAGGSATAAAGAKASARAAAIAAQAQRQTLNSSITNTVNAAPVRVRVSIAAPTEAKAPTEQPLKEATTAEKVVAAPDVARDERPVSTAYAPNINPTSPCALTVSGGIQARELGISFGGTPIAEFCKQLEIARAAYNMQDKATAEEIMCAEETYRAARRRAKRPCTQDLEAGAERASAILEDRHTRAYIAARDPALLP